MPVGQWRAPRATSEKDKEPLAVPGVTGGHVVKVAGVWDVHCHCVRPATRAQVSSELMTGLPRTCSRIAA
jgi:hypothetical protein